MTPGIPAMTIEIVVAPDGGTTVQTKGFTGPACRNASAFIEQALGKSVGETLTSEYHQTEPTAQRQTHHQ